MSTAPIHLRPLSPAGEPPQGDPVVWCRHVRYQELRCPEDLDALVQEYRGYALAIAHRLSRRGEPVEDLEQTALEALVGALQRFDTRRGIPFVGFATPTIAGAVKRHFRDRGWLIRAPRVVHELAGPIRTARTDLAGRLGRAPTVAEVARHLGVEEATVLEVDRAVEARAVGSLDVPSAADGTRSRSETVGAPDPCVERVADLVALRHAMADLSRRDREVLSLYYDGRLSQREIASRYGVSQMQVSRWLTSIVGRLRSHMDVDA